MSVRGSDPDRLLRWYPPAWRARYGDEMGALMADDLAGRPPTPRFRFSIAAAGLRERGHAAGLLGDRTPPAERVRAGALLVLGAWAAFVVAGASFAKLSEHFDAAVPAASRDLPWAVFRAIETLAVVGSLLVAAGALAALPALVRALRAGAWPRLRRPVLGAGAASVLVAAGTVGLVAWANRLSVAQRNGADGYYVVAFVVWGLAGAATLALWTWAAIAAGRRLTLTRRVLVLEAALAGGLALCMAAMTAATALWWAVVAVDAPWFLGGTAAGSHPSVFEPRLAATMALMLAAVAAAGYGVVRIGRAWGGLRAS